VLLQLPVGVDQQGEYRQLVVVLVLSQVPVGVVDSVPVGEDQQAAGDVRVAAEHPRDALPQRVTCSHPTAGTCRSSSVRCKHNRTLFCICRSCENTPY